MNPLLWPRWAQALAAATALIAAFLIWDHFDDRAAIRAHEAKVTAQVQKRSTEAAAAASEAVQKSRNQTEIENEHAREAAARSSDPLGDGLRSLRASRSDRPPAR